MIYGVYSCYYAIVQLRPAITSADCKTISLGISASWRLHNSRITVEIIYYTLANEYFDIIHLARIKSF